MQINSSFVVLVGSKTSGCRRRAPRALEQTKTNNCLCCRSHKWNPVKYKHITKSFKLLNCVQSIGYLAVWGNNKPHHLPTGTWVTCSSKEETQWQSGDHNVIITCCKTNKEVETPEKRKTAARCVNTRDVRRKALFLCKTNNKTWTNWSARGSSEKVKDPMKKRKNKP